MTVRVGVVQHRAGTVRVRAAAVAAARAVRPAETSPEVVHPAGMVRVHHNQVARVVAAGVISAGMTGAVSRVSAMSGVSQWRHCRKSRLR